MEKVPVINIRNAGIFFKRRFARNTLRSILAHGRGVRLKSDDFQALQEVSVSVHQGDVLGVIGKNGAGKSTLLRLIGGIYRPTSGSVEVNGSVASLLSLGAGFQQELSGAENIFLNGLLLGLSKQEIKNNFEQIVAFAELEEFIDQPVKTYSSGMVARLGFAIATHLKSDVLLIDEVLGVGDKDFKEKSKAKIHEVIGAGGTVVLVSHNLNEIKATCKDVLWLHRGQQRMLGPADLVVEAYEKS